jgi:hypothetical protein
MRRRPCKSGKGGGATAGPATSLPLQGGGPVDGVPGPRNTTRVRPKQHAR